MRFATLCAIIRYFSVKNSHNCLIRYRLLILTDIGFIYLPGKQSNECIGGGRPPSTTLHLVELFCSYITSMYKALRTPFGLSSASCDGHCLVSAAQKLISGPVHSDLDRCDFVNKVLKFLAETISISWRRFACCTFGLSTLPYYHSYYITVFLIFQRIFVFSPG